MNEYVLNVELKQQRRGARFPPTPKGMGFHLVKSMKRYGLFLLGALSLSAAPLQDYQAEPQIGVQNSILTKVNDKTISMIDVKKKLDMLFHQYYPHLIDSAQARFQFYEASWQHVLKEMINQELIIKDALDKEIKLTDSEIREEIELRFGPKVAETLDTIGLTHEEAWKMVRNEMIVQRMNWWFVHSKAVAAVTPQDIRQAYRVYIEKHPAYSDWSYRVVSIRSADEALANDLYQHLVKSLKPLEECIDELKAFEKEENSISVSNLYEAKSEDLSELHKRALASLEEKTYSQPILQVGKRDKKPLYRIFYLAKKEDHPTPSFEQISGRLKDELVQKAIEKTSQEYVTKLQKHYGYEFEESSLANLQPFSIQ